ncbi:uncharacterized protein LOC114187227 isoform X2 [Vigna unguiculata]|nr:uncharacterized protein LOC114187227 isoform X2 [Vigna unguiculata]
MDHSWMYNMLDPSRILRQEFINGVAEFVSKAMEQTSFIGRGIRCPCVNCKCEKIHKPQDVMAHLLKFGFIPNYNIWVNHGEEGTNVQNLGYASSSFKNMNCGDQFASTTKMVYDAYMKTCDLASLHGNVGNDSLYEESPSAEAQRFCEMLAFAKKLIYEGVTESRLSISIRLLAIRTKWHVSEECLDDMIQMLVDVTPKDNCIPKNYREAKKIVSSLGLKTKKIGLKAQKIDCCEDGCMHYKIDDQLTKCKFCHHPRYLPRKGVIGSHKSVPVQLTPSEIPVQLTPSIVSSSDNDLPNEEVEHDDSGRVIITPIGKGWTPNHHAIEAIGQVIRAQFRSPYHHYEVVPEDIQLRWWTHFKSIVTWAPQHESQIQKVYEKKVRKCLCDMLSKAKSKGTRPNWIGEQAWIELLNYWDNEKFKAKSFLNKMNTSSARGGALHSTGCKSHLKERKHGCCVNVDEFFLVTHTKKDGAWVDTRAHETCDIKSDGSTRSTTTTKIDCSKDIAGGTSRGGVDATGDLAANIHHGASSFTQPLTSIRTIHSTHEKLLETERLHEEVRQATLRAAAADEKAAVANQRAVATLKGLAETNKKFDVMEE